jgi:hypothetical protein
MLLQDKLSNDYVGKQTELEHNVRRILLFPFRFYVKKLQFGQFCADMYRTSMSPRDQTNIPKQAGVRQSKLINKFCCGIRCRY